MIRTSFQKSTIRTMAFAVALFVIFSVLVSMFPYSGDDWAWGSQIGLDRLETKFDNYNGRYAGNILVMLLTRSELLRTFVIAASLACVCMFPKLFSNTKSSLLYIFGAFLLLLLPKTILVQSVVWTAGYTNYIPPILMTLLYFIFIRNIFEDDRPHYHWAIPVISAIIGFISALFMENVTLYNIAISALIIGFVAVKHKRICITHAAHFISSCAGAVVMFSNSVYSSIANGSDSYRSTGMEEGLRETILSHTKVIFQQFFQNNVIVLMILSVLCLLVYVLWARKSQRKALKYGGLASVMVNIVCCFIIFAKDKFSYWVIGVGKENSDEITTYFFAVIAMLYCAGVLVTVLICVTSWGYKYKMLLLLGSVPILIAPLLIVNPIGPRCFFPPYLMLISACVVLFGYILQEIKFTAEIRKGIAGFLAAASLALLVFMFSIYSVIHSYQVRRDEYIEKQIDAGYDTVTVCSLPYDSYVWMGNPKADLWSYRFKLFYGIDQDVKFEFVTYYEFDKWTEKFDEEVHAK